MSNLTIDEDGNELPEHDLDCEDDNCLGCDRDPDALAADLDDMAYTRMKEE